MWLVKLGPPEPLEPLELLGRLEPLVRRAKPAPLEPWVTREPLERLAFRARRVRRAENKVPPGPLEPPEQRASLEPRVQREKLAQLAQWEKLVQQEPPELQVPLGPRARLA